MTATRPVWLVSLAPSSDQPQLYPFDPVWKRVGSATHHSVRQAHSAR